MEDTKVCDSYLVANAHHGFDSNSNEGSGSYCRTNIESNRLFDELKCSLLKLVLQGADKVFKDHKSQQANPFTDGHMQLAPLHDSQQGSFSESGRDWSSSSEISRGCKQENARVGAKLDNAFKDN
ncbi:Seipin domain-containing protein [Quillaja saponaria]|uniref:Seipin domain-containing protein n=1 Tax=Quillaja saponaria TaxID=32244 RepID=A0AAD7PAU8_QUISA|nr:Seipin domain-containing protein [Quillaja saponaria]